MLNVHLRILENIYLSIVYVSWNRVLDGAIVQMNETDSEKPIASQMTSVSSGHYFLFYFNSNSLIFKDKFTTTYSQENLKPGSSALNKNVLSMGQWPVDMRWCNFCKSFLSTMTIQMLQSMQSQLIMQT